MSKSLREYIEIYSPPNPILTHNDIDKLEWNPGSWADKTGIVVDYQNCDMSYSPNQEIFSKVTSWAKHCCSRYSQGKYFKITEGADPRFNRYQVGQYMNLHTDHIHSCFDGSKKGIPVISMVGVLNDDYNGGELVFYLGDDEYVPELKKGDTIVFPSAFPWKHEVKPVTSGVRYTWVTWAW
jgi:hypothetical protein